MLQTMNDRKLLKRHFRPAFSSISVAVLIIITVFSMIESVKSTNRVFLRVFILRPRIENAIILARVDFFHLQTQWKDYLFCLINGLRDYVALG
jgi:hypothetical protein